MLFLSFINLLLLFDLSLLKLCLQSSLFIIDCIRIRCVLSIDLLLELLLISKLLLKQVRVVFLFLLVHQQLYLLFNLNILNCFLLCISSLQQTFFNIIMKFFAFFVRQIIQITLANALRAVRASET